MYLLLYNNHDNFPKNLLSSKFIKVDVADIFNKKDQNDFLYKSNIEEYFLNEITISLDVDSNIGIHAIVINKDLGGSGWVRAANLAGHIACTIFKNCSLNTNPIILTDWSDLNIEDPTLKETSVNNFLQTEGIYFRKYEDLFAPVNEDPTYYKIDKLLGKLKSVKIDNISIKTAYDNKHQSTNEWGAIRLASNFGLKNEIQFKYPRHLYFKYLINYINTEKIHFDNSLVNVFSNVLLVDDNADCGWHELLEKIFYCRVDKLLSSESVRELRNVNPSKFSKYDLIFLDIYLDKENSDSTDALETLRFIKNKFPHIPVIIFTASDKAWNLDKMLEHGADAMYVKESPIYYNDEKYSIDNTSDFKYNILYVKNKYRVLTPYWKGIEAILSDSTFALIENDSKKIRSRIEERFKMFYGLLKKGFEQWDYDKNTFFYSDYELAFMTLWSVLNEIQEAYYDKLDKTPLTNLKGKNGESIIRQKNGVDEILPIPGFNWLIKGQNDYFIKHHFEFEGYDGNNEPLTKTNTKQIYRLKSVQASCSLKYDKNKSPHYMLENTYDRYSFHRELANQIAYLLLKKDDLKVSAKQVYYLETLHKLAEVRNHLYLTHGETSRFYFQNTEKEKRSTATYHITPHQDIKELFELILFLLTGKDGAIAIN